MNNKNCEQPKWISVKDRLPEEGQEVLAYWNCKKGIFNGNSVEVCDYNDGRWWDFHRNRYLDTYGTVTYWMPLPEPPKEGEPKC